MTFDLLVRPNAP